MYESKYYMAVINRKLIGQQLLPHQKHKYHQKKYKSSWKMHWSRLLVFSLLYLSCLLIITSAHVALTYPPARKYDFDFLDNSRTKGPCGMPKGSIHTSLLSGSKINVTWHLAYPHKGGFRLQLLDSLDRPLVDLTPQVNGSEFVKADATAQSYQVTLPNDFDCRNCTIRLLRQADEWSSSYRFWSCADVDIIRRKEFKETCSGNGKYFPSRCKCDKNFYGHRCQYRDECSSHQDCGIQGKCIDLHGTSLPRKQCYCNYGWYGVNCNKRSPYKNTDLDLSAYTMRELSSDFKIYWRLLEEQNEIEIILKVNGTSWVGFGWRPRSLSKECKKFPLIKDIGDKTSSQEPLSAEAEQNAEPELNSETEPKSEPEPSSEPQPKPKSLQLQPKPETESSSEPDPKSEPKPTPEQESGSKNEPTLKSKRVAENGTPLAMNGVTSVATSVSYRISASTGRRIRDILDSKKYKLNSYAPIHDFNPMDCTDIVIGSARGMASRVGDYYTRDRSTPRHDEFFGGKSDLTLATGFEQNGTTTIIFRKNLVAKESTDHTLNDDLTHVIWAKGQEIGNYIHFPASGTKTQMSSVKEFYQPDELKYHGHKVQRGVTQINFLEKQKIKSNESNYDSNVLDNDCHGHWKYPSNCLPQEHTCHYYASWETIGRGDDMRWHIETTNTQTWTGIGFSNDEKMSQTDSILGWVDSNGRPFLMDTWVNGYSSPKLDDRQDIVDASGHIKKGVTIVEFTRKRISNDEQDLSFTDDHCLYLFFPVLGGAFNAVNKKIRKHESVPLISPKRVCIKSCGKELEQNLNVPTTPAPNHLVYAIGIKLINLAESFQAPKPGTVEFKKIAAIISDSFDDVFNDIPGYFKTDIISFEKEDTTSVIANLQAIFDEEVYEKGHTLGTNTIPVGVKEAALNNGEFIKMASLHKISSGKVGSLTIDPHFLDFKALEHKSIDKSTETKLSFFELSEVRLYTVLGLIAALVFIVLIQAACTIYKASKNNKSNKENLIENSQWKEYSSNTNYAFDPYGETEEKTITSTAGTLNKDKSQNQLSVNNQQITLQMSQSPTSKSQIYYDNTANGGSINGAKRSNGNATIKMQEYRTNNRSYQRNRDGEAITTGNNDNSQYYRYDRTEHIESSEPQHHSRNSYIERAYSLPRQQHQQQANTQHSGYYTQDRRDRSAQRQLANDDRRQYHDRSREDPRLISKGGADTPDFYFMPSQRKYSGEVVRVYVDYNKDPKN